MAKDHCKALTLYWSGTGNTLKIADTIHETLLAKGVDSDMFKMNAKLEVNYFDYNLLFVGAPVFTNLPPKPIIRFLEAHKATDGEVIAAAPEHPGHFVVLFCTYGGGHTGLNEAVPMLKFMGQTFEHLGIRVVDEWPVVGFFRGVDNPNYNTDGRLGDITNRPDERDLSEVRGRVTGLLHRLKYKLPPLAD